MSEDDEARLAGYAAALADGIEAALEPWVVASVERVLVAASGTADQALMDQARAAGREAALVVGVQVRALLLTDIDRQVSTPLSMVRAAVRFPTAVLSAAGVPPVARDADSRRRFPDDPYDLTPSSWAELDPTLLEAGMRWGAAKAFVHRARRRAEGQS